MNSPDVKPVSPALMRTVLSCGGDEFTVKDVMEAAWWRGDMEPIWRELLEAVACEQRAEELGLEADEELLQALAEEFRYERDLLTTEETERWLSSRDLNEDDFNGYFLRRYWRQHLHEAARPEAVDAVSDSSEVAELLRPELMLSGEFERLARAFSWRLTALYGGAESQKPKAERERSASFSEWCSEAEAAYREVCGRLLTDKSRAGLLAAMRIPLTRIALDVLVVKSPSAAQEAALCLREQEVTLEELARDCASAYERKLVFLGDCSEEEQRRLLCAVPGEVLEPQPCDGGIAVCRLASKTEPDLADEAIQARIDQRLLETHFSELEAELIVRVMGGECPA